MTGAQPEHIRWSKQLGRHSADLDIPAGELARQDGYTMFQKAARILAFQPHMHTLGKYQCLELIYPTSGNQMRTEAVNCARFNYNWHLVYQYTDEAAPLVPAGTILHVISWHDNSDTNRANPDPGNWVGNGITRTIDEMAFSWIGWHDLTQEEYEQAIEARKAHREQGAGAQIQELPNLPWVLRYNAGQNVQPIFHGWSRNADGGFTMHFGYLNRNYVEQLHVPVGPDNSLGPGGPDQGQPTFFYARFRNYAFSVDVPGDWGDRRLVWEVTVHGRTDQAVAWLQPEWEINPPGIGGPSPGLFDSQAAGNQPPELNLEAAAPVTLPDAATLVANVRDDGLPKGPPDIDFSNFRFAVGQETPPTLQPGPLSAEAPVNVPQLAPAGGAASGIASRGRAMLQEGVSVSWTVW